MEIQIRSDVYTTSSAWIKMLAMAKAIHRGFGRIPRLVDHVALTGDLLNLKSADFDKLSTNTTTVSSFNVIPISGFSLISLTTYQHTYTHVTVIAISVPPYCVVDVEQRTAKRVPDFDLRRRLWCTLNCFTADQGRRAANITDLRSNLLLWCSYEAVSGL